MTVTVEAKAFHAALARVVGAVERNKSIPILQCVRISVEEGEMHIIATDLDVRIAVTIPASGECAATCTDYTRLLTIAVALKDRGELRIEPGEGTAVISCGRSRFTVGLLDASHWPELGEQRWDTTFQVEAPKFTRLMSALAVAISTEETRFYLNGIYLRPGSVRSDQDKDSLLGVATDGHKLYGRSIQLPGMPAGMAGIILPRWACATIAKTFGDAGQLTINCNDKKLQVSIDGVQYLTKLIEGVFPDWRRVTPSHDSALSYDRTELAKAAKVAAAGKADAKAGKAVKLTFGEDETTLEVIDPGNPQFSASDAVRHSQLTNPLAGYVGVNIDYLLEMLAEIDAETVEITPPEGASGPVLIRGATYDDRVQVIMSMRVV